LDLGWHENKISMDLNLFFEATVSTDEDVGVRYPVVAGLQISVFMFIKGLG
jgi:hypothetical protein